MCLTCLCRRVQSCFNRVTHISKALVNFFESKVKVSGDVFEPTPKRSDCTNVFFQIREKVSWVFFSFSASGLTERLTRITGSDSVYFVMKSFAWEGFKIRPNRYFMYGTRFHRCDQVRAGEGSDLHISDWLNFNSGNVKTFFESSIPCAKRYDSLGVMPLGIIHTIL